MNFRDLIPWARPTDYQKLSEEMYEVSQSIKKEKQMSNEFSFSVGPSFSFDDGAAITFKSENGLTTTVEMGFKHVQLLVNLLETVISEKA